jgi:hypothetical protein
MDELFFQGQSSLHPNDVSEAIHVHQIHDIVPLEVVESQLVLQVRSTNIGVLMDGSTRYFK